MTAKIEIVQKLGEEALLLPRRIADALAANDRLKLRLTLLQEALAHSRNPQLSPRKFEAERRAAGLADPEFDTTVVGARSLTADRLLVPGAKILLQGLVADLALMLAPLKAADTEVSRAFDQRFATLKAALPTAENDEIAVRDIDAMTAARRGDRDSVHLFVMDMHKAVNQLAADTAVETIDGAKVHNVTPTDRECVKAFMIGLNRTAGLAFGHPGLGTTAVRVGPHLTIQNDIGTTDAHVLVVHIGDEDITVTYTDTHRGRAKFFIAMFNDYPVNWSPLAEKDVEIGDADAFYLVTGRFAGGDIEQRLRFLQFLGSRIVFLIDWNKARKALQTFVERDAAIEILAWAAAHDHGHRAFLALGGTDLVFEAIRRAAAGRIPYGARLDAALGAVETVSFLRRVLAETSEGLRTGRSTRLIRDEIQADLAQLFDTAQAAAMNVLLRHLGITRMLATRLADAFAESRIADSPDDRTQLAAFAKRLEEKADRLTVEAREICGRIDHSDQLRQAIDEVENATDMLDEGGFLLSLAPPGDGVATIDALADLADMVIESVSQFVRAVEAASRLPQGQSVDATDALQAIDLVVAAERRADAAERDAFSAFMQRPAADARPLVLGLELARTLETATDHLAHAALALRDHVLRELSA